MNIKALGSEVRAVEATVDVGLEGQLNRLAATLDAPGKLVVRGVLARLKAQDSTIAMLNTRASDAVRRTAQVEKELLLVRNGERVGELERALESADDRARVATEDLAFWRGEAANEERLKRAYQREADGYLGLLQRIELAGDLPETTVGGLVAIARERLQ